MKKEIPSHLCAITFNPDMTHERMHRPNVEYCNGTFIMYRNNEFIKKNN